MAAKKNDPKREARIAKNNLSLNSALTLFTAGFIAEFYLLLINQYFVKGTIDQVVAVSYFLDAMVWVGAALVESISMGDPAARLTMFTNVLVFSTYATYVVMSFMMLVMIFMLFPQAQVSAERINEVLDTQAHIKEGKKTECPQTGTVEFRDVSFRYPNAAEDELEHISFKVEKGQTMAIIGATGSGKTTLVQLIPRFYDTLSGTVKVGGMDVRDYRLEALRDGVSMVLQKNVLFSGTILDNLRWGDENASEEVCNEASQTLQVLAGYTVAETQIENLVTAKGYADCVVFMGSESCSVVVDAGENGLEAQDVAKIKDIVINETQYTAGQIKIMEAD